MSFSPERAWLVFKDWFFEGVHEGKSQKKEPEKAAWWQVMCLTGVDYFSTLGYQPGIAFLAAGILSPFATIILVLLTLFAALPTYKRVSKASPHGQGSISMLERLFAGWKGKLLVLCLLGFAATDFMITITLSAADAAAHLIVNPYLPPIFHDRMFVTLCLISLLGFVFLKGFKEAIAVSVLLVFTYLTLNVIVLISATQHLSSETQLVSSWWNRLLVENGSVWKIIAVSTLLFPKLALGLSGFETGVAVMPLVRGYPDESEETPLGRIKNTQYLLATAAVIMSIFLIASSFLTTMLIPDKAFRQGGEADGRALAYLAHKFLGAGFGTIYDLSTIAILWFAGASAMAGLLNLVPRYLPRFGMAPDWARLLRPLVCFFTSVAFAITFIFKADVDAQGGAYATGVLVLMSSAAFAVMLHAWKESVGARVGFSIVFLVFVYTSLVNMIERPDGLKIACFFIAAIIVSSLISRALRSTELRVEKVILDQSASEIIADLADHEIRIIAHRPIGSTYEFKELESRRTHAISGPVIFLEVNLLDASEFLESELSLSGHILEAGARVFRCHSPAVPNAIAAILLHLRDLSGKLPHAYFGWSEGDPFVHLARYVILGEGETATVTREILRAAEPDPMRRPHVHVG